VSAGADAQRGFAVQGTAKPPAGKSIKRLLAFLLPSVLAQASLAAWEDAPAVAALFRDAGVTGTFVLYDPARDLHRGHAARRAQTRYPPASTFKIPNSVIGLATGAVQSVDEPLPYRAEGPAFLPEWERDMGLREAIGLSNVPIYQELARRIGRERMRAYLERFDYGNRDIGAEVDRFWLDGPLAISAVEQTRFLARLARGALPVPVDVQHAVRDILLIDSGPGWQLHGKTGWQNAPGAGIGWWVGWVEQEGALHAFALNIDMRGADDAPHRIDLGRASLEALGLLGGP
jgi:beta-lactamase class D